MRAYYHDNKPTDQRLPHDDDVEELSIESLKAVGVLGYNLSQPGTASSDDAIAKIDKIAAERDYKNRDSVLISPDGFGSAEAYKTKLGIFYEEHLHEDEEIRYILEGEGFFDVRTLEDRWVRVHMTAGDLLILPAGIYHRFTPTASDFVRAMRLFKDEPKWTPLPRPCDNNVHRLNYLSSVSA
ncbi:Acireductone dioxygenase ARD family [Dipodascopsis tothii]|uniref:Acireductone dioxygenase ARD family n=1 Tax=Dipodascopsis tothii TaxID=44089 RepID=UPI0034CF5053